MSDMAAFKKMKVQVSASTHVGARKRARDAYTRSLLCAAPEPQDRSALTLYGEEF